jgi:hypothetical protein
MQARNALGHGRLFIGATQRLGKHAVQQEHVHQRSHFKKPRGTTSSEGIVFTISRWSSAPADLVELVSRRANVRGKANTQPFARRLCPRLAQAKAESATR